MATDKTNVSLFWKKPDELIKLHRLKQKKKQLTARLNNNKSIVEVTETDKVKLLEAVVAQKRKNPFAKSSEVSKKLKTNLPELIDSISDDSVLSLISTPSKNNDILIKETPGRSPPAKLVLQPFDPKTFANLFHQEAVDDDADHIEKQKFGKHLPVDWSLKTRARFFCETDLPATKLKTSQEASGLTGFVRCIDTRTSSGGLDISPAAKLNQGTYYWQHPHLPWITLFPRNAKENVGVQVGERERKALASDWSDSFRGLFQLLRARQCPYFYLCANTFTVLFRAAGIGGRVETHAFMAPTSKGMRTSLRHEGIEFTLPLKKNTNLNKSGDESFSETKDQNEDTCEENEPPPDIAEDEEEEDWLASIGVNEKEIRKINIAHNRQKHQKEMADDFSDNSVALVEGVECQAFFNFLLNAKSTIASVGRLAGIPPTLLSPVAFPKATIENLSSRSNKVRMDGVDYFSVELKGIILPTILPYVCSLLKETKQTFSATLASNNSTLAFSKAAAKLIEDLKSEDTSGEQVFGKENLSDCGLQTDIVHSICKTEDNSVGLIERICFNSEFGYAWS